jgi:hypothetical protein
MVRGALYRPRACVLSTEISLRPSSNVARSKVRRCTGADVRGRHAPRGRATSWVAGMMSVSSCLAKADTRHRVALSAGPRSRRGRSRAARRPHAGTVRGRPVRLRQSPASAAARAYARRIAWRRQQIAPALDSIACVETRALETADQAAWPWWFVTDLRGLHPRALVESPSSFRRRGVFITDGALSRA